MATRRNFPTHSKLSGKPGRNAFINETSSHDTHKTISVIYTKLIHVIQNEPKKMFSVGYSSIAMKPGVAMLYNM